MAMATSPNSTESLDIRLSSPENKDAPENGRRRVYLIAEGAALPVLVTPTAPVHALVEYLLPGVTRLFEENDR
jgi:hypothetical protein